MLRARTKSVVVPRWFHGSARFPPVLFRALQKEGSLRRAVFDLLHRTRPLPLRLAGVPRPDARSAAAAAAALLPASTKVSGWNSSQPLHSVVWSPVHDGVRCLCHTLTRCQRRVRGGARTKVGFRFRTRGGLTADDGRSP